MMRIALLVLALVGLSMQACDLSKCVLPNCRCYDDPNQPGGLDTYKIPQMIMISFEGTISSANIDLYRALFTGVTNPNGCAVQGTFFIQDEGTSYPLVKSLATEGHEIGIHSVNGKAPTNSTGWIQDIKKVRAALDKIVDTKNVLGVRVPGVAMGGNGELMGIGSNNMLYDSTCSNIKHSDANTYLWPYTFDSMPTVNCTIGTAPIDPFPGKWEVMIGDLKGKDGYPCVVPSACSGMTSKRDAFELFFTAFMGHYSGKRTPFNIVIDPAWATNPDLSAGTLEFLQYVRATFNDQVWVVPITKALQWIQTPTPISNLTNFAPWQCNTQDTLLFKPRTQL